MVILRSYDEDKKKIKDFINEYYKDTPGGKDYIYKNSVIELSKMLKSVIYIDLDHFQEYDEELVLLIEQNALRYQKIFYEVIDELLFEGGVFSVRNTFDTFVEHRIRMLQRKVNGADANTPLRYEEIKDKFPRDLLRRYEAYFIARKVHKPLVIRNVLSDKIGNLIRIKAVVTRATQVKPLMKVATYTCDKCGGETYQEILNESFLPLVMCMSESCKGDGTTGSGRLHLQNRGSKYVKVQELRIQEVSEQVPIGNIPRSMKVHCVGENTRLTQPGDHIYVTGIFLPTVRAGFRSIQQTLTMETYLDAHRISIISKDNEDIDNVLTEFNETEIDKLRDPEMYSLMARSIAPEIFGHEDIKKALLIMLIGGTKLTPGGINIRGNLNICLMGDPGVAKSQLLGFVDRLSPRSQYTTGKGSSGVGLTAAVMKDPLTGEMTLEGGSLVLADGGVCCIDEFDKMNEHDRTSIHEVMEQQTISIAKAGIITTLNARVSILSAANPAYGRYNPKKSIEQNVDLPAALLSRFDLLWLIQDKPDKDNDLRLAQHITYVHANNEAPKVSNNIGNLLSMQELRHYLAVIHSLPDPVVPNSLMDYVVGAYVNIRKEAKQGNRKDTTYTSARTLLGIIRIATSLARLRAQREVVRADIDEAIRLLESSKASVRDSVGGKSTVTYQDSIYRNIASLFDTDRTVKYDDALQKCLSLGFTKDQFDEVVETYERLNIWQLNVGRTRLKMIG